MIDRDPDPRPVPPERPLPGDCCDSGCECCVQDTYAEALADYQARLARWLERHPDAA
ncbi:MAG: oxidoreductase-like protein [Dokdonella sp.]|uniref:oxidoreductase-like domain-containing protein n=1 Tax=Dokdonella sp. TaxID=2291710 RepID=UPI0025C39502|nr:oxidoreductase-like domain-containing protein [Dokdonella sp.]MBX3700796.1 oxidoreductase-like protein [Dokdonella sp.]MCW5577889.1 oxidoreductase-like protein [Dokdonella sp.]